MSSTPAQRALIDLVTASQRLDAAKLMLDEALKKNRPEKFCESLRALVEVDATGLHDACKAFTGAFLMENAVNIKDDGSITWIGDQIFE